MRKRFYYALTFIVFSFGLILMGTTHPGITGAVIGTSSIGAGLMFLASMIFLLGAAVLFITATEEEKDLEKLVSPEIFTQRLAIAEPDKDKRVIVMDASAIISYGQSRIAKILSAYDKVVIPEKVLDQLKDSKLRKYVADNARIVNVDSKYRELAEEFLGECRKKRFLDVLEKKRPKPTGHREAQEFRKLYFGLVEHLKNKGTEPDISGLIKEAKRHFHVDPADVDVLATALYFSDHGKHAIIAEKDIDFEDALKVMPDGTNIDCVNPYAAKNHTFG